MSGLVLEGPAGGIEISIEGFAYPDEDGDDGDWLIVAGRCHADGRAWAWRGPCLLVSEVGPLVAWLRGLGGDRDEPQHARIDFMEPDLAFVCERLAGGSVRIRVLLALEAAPRWWSSYAEDHPDLAIDESGLVPFEIPVELDVAVLRRAADTLGEEAAHVIANRVPARGRFM